MKKTILFPALIFFALVTFYAQAQWTISGTNIYNSNTGNVGVGTTTPTVKLDVFGSNGSGSLLRVYSNSAPFPAIVEVTASNSSRGTFESVMTPAIGVRIGSKNNYDFSLFTNDVNKMIVKTDGKVGIGTTTPTQLLDVNGIINATALYINGLPFAGGGSQWATSGSNISYNASGGNVGIGTTTPTQKLDVNGIVNATGFYLNGAPFTGGSNQQWDGSTTTTGTISRTGNIAIGPISTIPNFASIFLSNNGGANPDLMFHNGDAAVDNRVWSVMAQGGSFRILTETDNFGTVQDAINIRRSGVNVTTTSFPNGNVAIGTSLTNNPNGYKLAVKGKIGAQEVQVENTSSTWADYVFESDYKLMPLRDVEIFVKHNKHLPEIPSAQDVKENGHKLGEMDVLLLKKVEEMTLYMLEQEKRIKSLEDQIVNLTKK